MRIDFYCRKSKINKKGLSPIYAKITLNGTIKERATGVRCKADNWDAGYKAIKNDVVSTKKILDFEINLIKKYETIKRDFNTVSFEDLDNDKPKTISDILEEFAIFQLSKKNATGTKSGDGARIKRLNDFVLLELKTLHNISPDTTDKYVKHLIEKKDYEESTLLRHNKFINMFLRFCFSNGYLNADFSKTVVKLSKPTEIIHLTVMELEALRRYKFSSKSLERVRDMFLFCSNTGLSFADLAKFNKSYIQMSTSNAPYISICRQKTKQNCIIPLSTEAENILEKYDYKLPVISMDKYNKYIKECCEVVGIEKKVTSHVARKTCGMMLLNMGMSYDTVAKVLGHSNSKITQDYYARYMPETIIEEYNQTLKKIG